MKTVIEQLFKDIEKHGIETVLHHKKHYLLIEEHLVKNVWQNGRNSGLMGSQINANEFYTNLIKQENEK